MDSKMVIWFWFSWQFFESFWLVLFFGHHDSRITLELEWLHILIDHILDVSFASLVFTSFFKIWLIDEVMFFWKIFNKFSLWNSEIVAFPLWKWHWLCEVNTEVEKANINDFFWASQLTINLQKPDTKFTKQGYLFLMEKSKLSKYICPMIP